MSVRTDFYLLNDDDSTKYQNFLCKLVEKIYRRQHRIYIHSNDETQAHQIDQWLWTYDENSFLPHLLVNEGLQPAPPIQIGYETAPPQQHDILINLTPTVPEFFNKFKRIVEIINETTKTAARERYKIYRDANHAIKTHNIDI